MNKSNLNAAMKFDNLWAHMRAAALASAAIGDVQCVACVRCVPPDCLDSRGLCGECSRIDFAKQCGEDD